MFSMAIADLLMGFILIPQAYRESLINETLVDETELESNDTLAREHYFDEHFCRFLTAGTWLSVTTSIYTFTIVSFARYIATVHEELFNRYFPAETAHYSIIPCWVFGIIQAIPLLTSWNDKTVSDFTTCSLPVKCEAWLTWSGVTVFYIPTTIIMVCYLLVLLKVRKEGISIAPFAMILLNALFFPQGDADCGAEDGGDLHDLRPLHPHLDLPPLLVARRHLPDHQVWRERGLPRLLLRQHEQPVEPHSLYGP